MVHLEFHFDGNTYGKKTNNVHFIISIIPQNDMINEHNHAISLKTMLFFPLNLLKTYPTILLV